MKKVVIIQARLLHYRLALFEQLREACQAQAIELCLVHGQATEREEKKRDTGSLPWANVVINRYISVGRRDVLWQPFPKEHRDADMVIFMQENRLLSNYYWLFMRAFHRAKVAYWGHGRNFQTDSPTGLLEKWKQFLIGHVDWWFAYTELTRQILLADGYPNERITLLDNAIDSEGFVADLASISNNRLAELRRELTLPEDAQVGLFCGSLYPDKRLDYMIAAADKIHAALPKFHLLVIGDGPSIGQIQDVSASRPWLHSLGVRKGVEKAAYFRLAHVVFNPGAVGLHVLDSFCAGVPMVTTSDALHGPEIAYLENEKNGLIVKGSAEDYSAAVISLLQNSTRYAQLKAGALAGAQRYTLAHMVENFVDGMVRCLQMNRKF